MLSPFQRGNGAANLCTLGFSTPPSGLKLCFPSPQTAPGVTKAPPCSKGGRMQREGGRHPGPCWVPALRAGPGARSQSPAVGICCVYLQSNNDPGTARRMSQLAVQGRILHQPSQLKNHHLELQQLNNFIKLALLISDRLKPFHFSVPGRMGSSRALKPFSRRNLSPDGRWRCPQPPGAQPARCRAQRVNTHLWSCTERCWLPGAQPSPTPDCCALGMPRGTQAPALTDVSSLSSRGCGSGRGAL